MELKGWIARDKDGQLWLHVDFPARRECGLGTFVEYGERILLPEDSFPDVTGHTHPQGVTIKIEKE